MQLRLLCLGLQGQKRYDLSIVQLGCVGLGELYQVYFLQQWLDGMSASNPHDNMIGMLTSSSKRSNRYVLRSFQVTFSSLY